ncbi:carbohydrate ABC transporter permease [Promicromonospora sp. Marseille-Q5078]
MIYPLLWMVVSSLRPDDLIFSQPGLWLGDVDLSHYPDGWNALTHPFGRYMLNSAVVVLGSVLGTLVSCSMAAYAFARMRFSGRTILFAIMLITIMLPGHVTLVPQYVLFSQLGMVNTFWPLVGPNMLATDSFFIFLMVQFIRGLPKELDEAARIDGAGHARIFLRIILPLMTPALATTAIFTFIGTWNQFFSALIYLTDTDMMTVPVALRLFVDSQGESNWGAMFAMSIVSLLPVFLVFLFGQRFLIRGIATTGIK